MPAHPQPDPEPAPAALADDERRARERQEAIDAYNARRVKEGLPPLDPERAARFVALDEEVAARAAAMRRHDEQKRAQEAAKQAAQTRSAYEIIEQARQSQKARQEREAASSEERSEAQPTPEPPQPAAPEVPPVGQLIMFPQWGDERRAAAAAIFRSALFPPLNFKKARPFLKEAQVYATKGIEIYFTGEQFDQSDLDVYLELLHIARATPLGVECCFTAYGLLKALGRATGKANHKWLHSVIIRLCGGVVDMTDHKTRYFGHLVESGIKEEISKHYRVRLNPEMARVFRGDLWASLDIQQRRDLKQNQTAKALQAYYATHANPGPHRYETLAAIIGLKNSSPKDLKRQLVKAHGLLKEVGCLSDFEAGTDTITPKVNHTPSQNRHLIRKATEGTAKPKRRKTDTKEG